MSDSNFSDILLTTEKDTLPPTATIAPPPTATPQPEIVSPQARIQAPSSGYIGEPVKVDASGSRQGSSPIVSYTWSFGNGTGRTSSAITLRFLNGQLAGFAGCNDYNGSYIAPDNGDGTFGVTVDRLNTGWRACACPIKSNERHLTCTG